MIGLEYRMQAFINPSDHRALIVDTSAGLSLGALPGLEHFTQAVRTILPHANGVVCSPGQITRLTQLVRQDAGLLVRMDWNNTLRSDSLVLPMSTPHRVPLLSVQDALDLGAVGMVNTFLLGFEEAIEAACLRSTVHFALEGKSLGIPLIVDVQPTGPRVSLPGKAVELGVSYALEGGAEAVALPYPGSTSLKTISQFCSIPWFIKPTTPEEIQAVLQETLSLGGAGLYLDHSVFTQPDPANYLDELLGLVHQPAAAVQ